jgi:hypothetical protein
MAHREPAQTTSCGTATSCLLPLPTGARRPCAPWPLRNGHRTVTESTHRNSDSAQFVNRVDGCQRAFFRDDFLERFEAADFSEAPAKRWRSSRRPNALSSAMAASCGGRGFVEPCSQL